MLSCIGVFGYWKSFIHCLNHLHIAKWVWIRSSLDLGLSPVIVRCCRVWQREDLSSAVTQQRCQLRVETENRRVTVASCSNCRGGDEFFIQDVLKAGTDGLHKSRDTIIKQTALSSSLLAKHLAWLLSRLAAQIGNPASAKAVISVTSFPNKALVLDLSSK